MTPEVLLITLLVVSIVQVIKYVKEKAWDSVVTIVSAALVGGVVGAFNYHGLDIPTGIVLGLSATGLVTVAQKFGGN